jgi:hypothetical protein
MHIGVVIRFQKAANHRYLYLCTQILWFFSFRMIFFPNNEQLIANCGGIYISFRMVLPFIPTATDILQIVAVYPR